MHKLTLIISLLLLTALAAGCADQSDGAPDTNQPHPLGAAWLLPSGHPTSAVDNLSPASAATRKMSEALLPPAANATRQARPISSSGPAIPAIQSRPTATFVPTGQAPMPPTTPCRKSPTSAPPATMAPAAALCIITIPRPRRMSLFWPLITPNRVPRPLRPMLPIRVPAPAATSAATAASRLPTG